VSNPSPGRAVSVTVAIAVPVTAAVLVAVGRLLRRPTVTLTRVPELGIRNVPARPPLWRTVGPPPMTGPIDLSAVSPVPPENPHAPPTPPLGTPRQTA
jgi:hypothetical protein